METRCHGPANMNTSCCRPMNIAFGRHRPKDTEYWTLLALRNVNRSHRWFAKQSEYHDWFSEKVCNLVDKGFEYNTHECADLPPAKGEEHPFRLHRTSTLKCHWCSSDRVDLPPPADEGRPSPASWQMHASRPPGNVHLSRASCDFQSSCAPRLS